MSSTLNNQAFLTPEERRAMLLAKQAEIAAELASLPPSGTPATSSYRAHHRSNIQKQQHHRRSDVPRSMSISGAHTMSRHLSSDRTEATKLSRSISHQSAPMARTTSRGSGSQRSGKNPFTSNGPHRQAPPRVDTQLDNPAMNIWTSSDQPFSTYAPSHESLPLQRSTSQRKPELKQVPEHTSFLEDPSDYLSRQFGTPITPTMSMASPTTSTALPTYRTSALHYAMPSPPSTDSTSATTFTNYTMSRSNSHFTEPLSESIQMMRFDSNASYLDNHVDYSYQSTPTALHSSHVRRSSNEEQSQLLSGAGGVGHNSLFSQSLPASFDSSLGVKMEKSPSNESASSASSRSKQQLQKQIQMAAARPIMPKGGSDDNSMSRDNSTQSLSRLESKYDLKDKVLLSKPTYQRPKHDRVFCKLCDSHPEGYRGEHELRRHQDREHKQVVRRWVCIEPVGDGLKHPTPILPLSKCKACGHQKRTYGAYYNAAAHLRRAHFKPKSSKGRSKLSKEDVKRGGMGGGDWPPMSELKHWMKEVEETAPQYNLTESQEEQLDLEEMDAPPAYTAQDITTLSNEAFAKAVSEASPLFDTFQPLTHDVYDIQMLSDTQSQYMDTMYNNSCQVLFSDFPSTVYPHDNMSFYDSSLTQNISDQVIVADLD